MNGDCEPIVNVIPIVIEKERNKYCAVLQDMDQETTDATFERIDE